MSQGLVTIAVAGDAAEADSIVRTLAAAGIGAQPRRGGGRSRRSPHDGPCRVLVESELVGAAQAALLEEDDRPTTTTDRDEGTPTAIFDRMAERYDDLRVREEQLAEQFAFTVAQGLGAGDATARRGVRHRLARGDGGRAAGRQGMGRRRLRADAREGARAARARRRVQARAGGRPAVPRRLVRRRHDAARRAHARRPPAARAGRGAARARARGAAVRLDVRARALHGPPPAAYLPDLPAIDLARFPSADVLTRELAAAGFADVRGAWFEQAGSVSRARAAEQLRARHLSTIHLLPQEQVAAAAERLEREAAAARAAAHDGAALAASRRARDVARASASAGAA